MAAILSTNMASLYAQKNLSTAQASLSESVQRLSSGTRINSAKDDAAGYGIAESVRGTKNIVDQNIRNAKDGISWAQTAEGALDVVGKILQRTLTLTTQKLDPTLNNTQQAAITAEIQALHLEVVAIGERTKFQGGSNSVFAAGNNSISINTGSTQSTVVTANLVGTAALASNSTTSASALAALNAAGVEASTTLDNGLYTNFATTTNGDGAGMKLNFLVELGEVTFVEIASGGSGYAVNDEIYINGKDGTDEAIFKVSTLGAGLSTATVEGMIAQNATNRSALGAAMNSLEYAVDNMQTLSTNLADGISRIVDTDYAAETSNLTRTQILQQAATSMLAQANQMPNVILTLLK